MDKELEAYARLSKKHLFGRIHALALALGRLRDVSGIPGGTDGSRVFWPYSLLSFSPGSSLSDTVPGERFLLHQVLHCLLGHPFRLPPDGGTPFGLHDAACDLKVWKMIEYLAPELFPECLRDIRKDILSGNDPEETERIRILLSSLDDHSRWPAYQPAFRKRKLHSGSAGEDGEGWERLAKQLLFSGGPLSPRHSSVPKRNPMRGSGIRHDVIRPVLTDSRRGDYRSLLKELAVWGEDLRLNPSEFDLASYLYGLENCGIPLLEPLEYEDAKRIRELAIVIDTSESCSGSLVQAFLEETRNLILEEDLFFHPFNLHIIQCDSKVQKDDRITSLDDLKDYIDTLEVRGMGGTDFRPAFSHIRTLEASGEFSCLAGILYFTDGLGLYPSAPPGTETVFIFMDQHYEDMDVPSWARTLVLKPDEAKGNHHEY